MQQREVEIDIDDYRKNPQLRQRTAQQTHHKGSHQGAHHKESGHQIAGYCTQCGTPLLKKHKYCPICGNRV